MLPGRLNEDRGFTPNRVKPLSTYQWCG